MSNHTQLVIFDCDGVVIDSEVISANVLIDKLALLGAEIDMAFVQQHFLGCKFATVAQKIEDLLSLTLSPQFELEYREQLLAVFEHQLTLTAGFNKVLAQLTVPYCIATSSSLPRTTKALSVVGLTDVFSGCVFTASEVKRGKPAPDLFLHAAERMGVKPEHCLVIEDSFFGVTAAVAANMPVIHYVGGGHMDPDNQTVLQAFSQVPVLKHWDDFSAIMPALMR
ncbi:haloacid dehalogenase [Shewanella algicola]|uniref:HAD family hydrolase n=1 Tax=Shewanella algicola TaxID=640633 RepID=A0A9X2CEE3_9GAMM|nr:HAD family hydrolase [Shewanella algicola]MCL1107723.1 HAD family hydrolase [Shewanella algicola]GGP72306.1 haloacid dehalogenase [Shewanella algicola]